MKFCFILYLSIHFFQLVNLEYIDMWKKQELVLGVVDRIEGDKAVILMEEKNEELILDAEKINLLARENEWFLISLKEGKAVYFKALPNVTSEKYDRNRNVLKELRKGE